MKRTMFEMTFVRRNEILTGIEVNPITVIREGILPGCSAPTITAKDKDGNQFYGNPDDYFDTEQQAWNAAIELLNARVNSCENELIKLQNQFENDKKLLTMLMINHKSKT